MMKMYSLKKINDYIFTSFMILWQLPQTFLAGLFFIFLFDKIKDMVIYKGKLYYTTDTWVNLCFGEINFINLNSIKNYNHKYGHSIQSVYFGPLYGIIIGIPALYNYLINKFSDTRSDTVITEYWATEIGKLENAWMVTYK